MSDFEKECLDRMEQILIKLNGREKVKRVENSVIFIDPIGRRVPYFFDKDLYQKTKDEQVKMYPYIIKWYDDDIDYFIEAEDETSVRARITIDGFLQYSLQYRQSYSDIADFDLIEKRYKILKEYIENKKEYRVRIKTGVMEIEIDHKLKEISKKVAL